MALEYEPYVYHSRLAINLSSESCAMLQQNCRLFANGRVSVNWKPYKIVFHTIKFSRPMAELKA